MFCELHKIFTLHRLKVFFHVGVRYLSTHEDTLMHTVGSLSSHCDFVNSFMREGVGKGSITAGSRGIRNSDSNPGNARHYVSRSL